MRSLDIADGVRLLDAALLALLKTPRDRSAPEASELRRAVGAFLAGAGLALARCSFGADLGACFDLALGAGATREGLALVRKGVMDAAPATPGGEIVRQAILVQGVAREALALAAGVYTSQAETEALMLSMNDVFDGLIEFAADHQSHESYNTLIALHAALAADMTARGRTLPDMVSYAFPGSRPTLWISNRLYGDADHSADIARENRIGHPLFAPATGRALTR